MYEVRWTNPAITDLFTKVRTPVVRSYLFAVGRTALDCHHDARWGGRFDDGSWWRRGITLHDQADPNTIQGGATSDGQREMPFDYVLVYLRSVAVPESRPFLVLGVATNQEIVAGSVAALFDDGRVARWSSAHYAPGGSRRRRRARRRRDDGAGGRR